MHKKYNYKQTTNPRSIGEEWELVAISFIENEWTPVWIFREEVVEPYIS